MKARVQKFVSMILVLLLCVSPLLGTNNVYASDDGNSNAYGTEETSKANNSSSKMTKERKKQSCYRKLLMALR